VSVRPSVRPGSETHIPKKTHTFSFQVSRNEGITSSSCPWHQKEKQTLPVPCVTFSSYPWQQKENSKQGRAGAAQRRAR